MRNIDRSRVSLDLPRADLAKLKTMAHRRGIKLAHLMRWLVNLGMERVKESEKPLKVPGPIETAEQLTAHLEGLSNEELKPWLIAAYPYYKTREALLEFARASPSERGKKHNLSE